MEDAEGVMERYCKYIYTNDETGRIRTQAILYNIYHLALHDKWFQARDLMLMSHLQESIHNADIVTQIIYNRTMVQLGLCAFRKGQMEDAHQVNYSNIISVKPFKSKNRDKIYLGAPNPNLKKGSDRDFRATA